VLIANTGLKRTIFHRAAPEARGQQGYDRVIAGCKASNATNTSTATKSVRAGVHLLMNILSVEESGGLKWGPIV
jgi:hypothetical protein